jgi:hypothetical protein
MHIPHFHPPLTGAVVQYTNLQKAAGRNTAGQKNRRVEDADDSLFDLVILSDHEQPEDGEQDPAEHR